MHYLRWAALSILFGCATSSTVGNFLEHTPEGAQRALGVAAATRVKTLVQPRSALTITPSADDPFTATMVDALRRAGFAVHVGGPRHGVAVSYVVDELGPRLCRLELHVWSGRARARYVRVYAASSSDASAAGPWVVQQ